MANLYDLKPFVLPYAGGCPAAVVEQAIRLVMMDFAAKAEVWREIITASTAVDEDEYQLTPSANTKILRVQSVEVDGTEVKSSSYYISQDDILVFDAAHTAVGVNNISVLVVVSPTIANTTCPTWLYTRYFDTLRQGVLANVKSMTGKPWADPEGYQLSSEEYRKGWVRARCDIQSARHSDTIRVTIPKI